MNPFYEAEKTIECCGTCGEELIRNTGRYIFDDKAYCVTCWRKADFHMKIHKGTYTEENIKEKIKNWEALIKWFELLKEITGIRTDDNFSIASEVVLIDGQNLQFHMAKFWMQEGLCNEREALRLFDLSSTNNRMRIKLHLIEFLDNPYSYEAQFNLISHLRK